MNKEDFHAQAAERFYAGLSRWGRSSGREQRPTRREIARDLGIGLSSLRHWIDRRRERRIERPPGDGQEDVAAEVKRLRRENEILRQERDIL